MYTLQQARNKLIYKRKKWLQDPSNKNPGRWEWVYLYNPEVPCGILQLVGVVARSHEADLSVCAFWEESYEYKSDVTFEYFYPVDIKDVKEKQVSRWEKYFKR